MKIGIIGGAGHIGLPMSLVLAKKFNVTIIDPSKDVLKIKECVPPFFEFGIKKYLTKKILKNIEFTKKLEKKKKYDAIIIALGTPVDEWSNPSINNLVSITLSACANLKKNGLLILRSTVVPGLCKKISNRIKRKKINLFYCPERIVQGFALIEMNKIPQIVGSEKISNPVKKIIKKIFFFSKKFIFVNFYEAELIKLFSNFWRYATFAVSNQMYLVTKSFNLSYTKILNSMKEGYSRAKDIPYAGFAAGPCLYKDTQQLSSSFEGNFSLGKATIEINEGLADYVATQVKKLSKNKRIIILGASFKANSDDFRDSLSFRLFKNLKRLTENRVILYDPNVNHPKVSKKIKLNFKKDFFVLSTPHRIFNSLLKKISKKNLYNVWND